MSRLSNRPCLRSRWRYIATLLVSFSGEREVHTFVTCADGVSRGPNGGGEIAVGAAGTQWGAPVEPKGEHGGVTAMLSVAASSVLFAWRGRLGHRVGNGSARGGVSCAAPCGEMQCSPAGG